MEAILAQPSFGCPKGDAMLGSDGRQQHTVFKVGFKHLKALKSLSPVVFGKGLERGGINMNSKISEVSKYAAGDSRAADKIQ
ncbi:MAG: hypothetical protein ACLQF1_17390 [Methyloceanibacter sp.]